MELFQTENLRPKEPSLKETEPLAARMAPRDWDEFVGQNHLVSSGSLLRRAIEADRLGSSVFFGPTGTGKTALARLAAKKSRAAIEYVNAVTAGVADLRNVVKRAVERRKLNGQRTLLVVDEIHHFNRTQQDALLPDVERGNLTLIGLTTENPFFYVNAALMSRSTAFEFRPLTRVDLEKIYAHTLEEKERGLGAIPAVVAPDAKEHFINSASGDARRLLNALELAFTTTPPDAEGNVMIDLSVAEASAQKRSVRYDKSGDEHYDTISAFIKSMRGSDPDAALYWMAKMLAAGEDPRFIARRVMIFAAEDVGNADPMALVLCAEATRVVEMVGMPEARIPLAQAVTYVASAPKSNAAYMGIAKAMKEVENGPIREVPNHLKDSNMDRESRGHGKGYLYPHDFPGHHVKQTYMPKRVEFYQPTDQGKEAEIKVRLDKWRKDNPA
jgi:putative ATPase